MAAILKNRYNVISLRRQSSDCYEIWQVDAKWHADDYHRSKSQPEVEFQYGGGPFSKTGSNFVSAVDSGILSKFITQIDIPFLNRCYH